MVIGLTSSCDANRPLSNAPTNSQELRVTISAEPLTFDPGQQQWAYEAAVGRNTFEALLKPTQDLKGVTGLAADSYSVDDTGVVYTFKLHQGARWGDGQPVKADDFVYAWQRLLDPRLGATYASYYYPVKNGSHVNQMDPKDPGVDAALQTLGLKAVDDNTFQVTLQAPAGYFKWVATLWTGAPVRRDVIAKAGKDSAGNERWGAVARGAVTNVVGNGQFKVSEVVSKDHITLVQNPNYAGSSPKAALTKITVYEIADASVAYDKYRNGGLDMTPVPINMAADDSALRGELVKVPDLTVFWLAFNVSKAPFDNVSVRRAFAQAIDRDALVNSALNGRGVPATSLIPDGMLDFDSSIGSAQPFNVSRAKAALEASGMTASQLSETNLTYTYNNGNARNTAIAQFVQAQLKTNLGVTIQLDGAKSISERLKTRNYMMSFFGWADDYPDPQDWFDTFLSSAGGWSNAGYDQAVNQADASSDQSRRHTLYMQAESILIHEAPVVFLEQPTSWYLVKPYVKNLNGTLLDDPAFLGDVNSYTIQIAQH